MAKALRIPSQGGAEEALRGAGIGSEVAQAIESGAGHGSANEAEVETVIAVGQGSGAAGEVARASESAADLASASAAAPLTESATEGSAAVSVGGTEAPVERGGADRNTGSNSLEKLSRKYAVSPHFLERRHMIWCFFSVLIVLEKSLSAFFSLVDLSLLVAAPIDARFPNRYGASACLTFIYSLKFDKVLLLVCSDRSSDKPKH
ncbi:hypothetical protein Y032_0006g3083 [Ancylostoma ceylanicum]|uniref:Uncharacterized protein n=1 Tax=Ancylostoma ceylanicum TaxID=53326 RepID=A0A016VQF2_9BILA|nr:hypothetical protein Y032_0006g3083 [Ancylostoma ceylanicum]